jgi:sulfonate transport system ATP-binding protein
MGEPAPPLLEVSHLTLQHRTENQVLTAVEDVSFRVHRANRCILLGPSGCGKTTLLDAVGGYLAPAAGQILIHGRPITGPGPDRIMIFQEFDQLLPWKTVRQNVLFPLLSTRRCDRRTAEQRAAHYIDKVGLAAFAEAYPHTLSGGMKQRVALARGMAMEPDMLLMDEPFAALDALTRGRMQDELLRLWEEVRFTMLFVTHAIEEAIRLGDRIILLSPHPGRLRAELAGNGHDDPDSAGTRPSERIHAMLFAGGADVEAAHG